jgi:hypothetical protein
MRRFLAFVCVGLALAMALSADPTAAADKIKVKNQMIKGTIKSVDADKDVLVINQKVKNEVVDRELSILDTTEFVVTTATGSKTATGNAGLQLLEGREGSSVQVKCDKDVNVLKVTVTSKK